MKVEEYEKEIQSIAREAANLIEAKLELLNEKNGSIDDLSFEDGVIVGVHSGGIVLVVEMLRFMVADDFNDKVESN